MLQLGEPDVLLKVLEQMPNLIKKFEVGLSSVAPLLKTLIVLEKSNFEIAMTNWRVLR